MAHLCGSILGFWCGFWSLRPQTETAKTETATNRKGHKPERPQTETATNRIPNTQPAIKRYLQTYSVAQRPYMCLAIYWDIILCVILVCGRFGLWPFRSAAVSVCGRFGLWPYRFVAVLVCGRFGLWPFRFVAVPVCGRCGLWPFWFWPFRFVAVMTCYRKLHHHWVR